MRTFLINWSAYIGDKLYLLSLGLLVFGDAVVQLLYQAFPLPEFFLRTWDWVKYVLSFAGMAGKRCFMGEI